MKVLALETSERVGSIAALTVDQRSTALAAEVALPPEQRSAQSLLPAIEGMMSDLDWQLNELGLMAVTTGPGSFTGCRIGVTTAKTLSYATGAQLVGVHTLVAIAAGVTSSYRRLWTILDAQRGELFVSKYDDSASVYEQDAETNIIDAEDWLRLLAAGDVVAGPPLKKLQDQLPPDVAVASEEEWKPRAEVVGRVAIEHYRAGRTVDPVQLVPNYFRKSAAEEKADSRD